MLLASLRDSNGATNLVSRAYARTDALNLTGITDTVTAGNSQTLGYSAANRLATANGPWGAKVYTYDGVGNRTTEATTPPAGATVTDTYGYPTTSNRVIQITRGTQTTRQLTYDNAGNLVTDSAGQAYVYNKRDRLSVATVGALVYNYTYNALEQLAIRAVVSPASTTHFIHDRMGNVIAETAGGGPTGATGTVREYIWLYEAEIAPTSGSRTVVDRPLSVVDAVNTASPVLYYVSVDHLNRQCCSQTPQKRRSGVQSGCRGAGSRRSPAPPPSTPASPASGSKPKPACITTGTGTTIQPSAATPSPIRSGSSMVRVCMGMRNFRHPC